MQKNLFCSFSHITVLHRRFPHNGCWVNRVFSVGNTGNVENRIIIFKGIIPGVISEGAFHMKFLVYIHISFQDEFCFCRDKNIVSDRLHHSHRHFSEETRKHHLIKILCKYKRQSYESAPVQRPALKYRQFFKVWVFIDYLLADSLSRKLQGEYGCQSAESGQ